VGYGHPWLCSRIVHRLQKSTGGAWPLATVDEESAEPTMGLAPPRESAREGEGASEAESSVAKPRDRWRAPANRRNCESSLLGALVEERRSGPWQAVHVDVGAVEAVLVPRRLGNSRVTSGRDRGRQRSFASSVLGRQRRIRVAPSVKVALTAKVTKD